MNFTLILISGAIGALSASVGVLLALTLFRRPRDTGVLGPAPPTRGLSSVQQAVVLSAVLLGIGMTNAFDWDVAIEETLFPERIFANVAERAARRLQTDPAFEEAVRGKSRAEARELGRVLTVKGIRRLPLAELRRLGELRRLVAERSDEACAALWVGGAEPGVIERALRKLSRSELEEFFALSGSAALLELRGTGEPFVAQDQVATFDAITVALGERGREFRRIASEGALTPRDDACKAMLMMHDALPALSEEHQRTVLTSFAE